MVFTRGATLGRPSTLADHLRVLLREFITLVGVATRDARATDEVAVDL